jgi:hypothetical protein
MNVDSSCLLSADMDPPVTACFTASPAACQDASFTNATVAGTGTFLTGCTGTFLTGCTGTFLTGCTGTFLTSSGLSSSSLDFLSSLAFSVKWVVQITRTGKGWVIFSPVSLWCWVLQCTMIGVRMLDGLSAARFPSLHRAVYCHKLLDSNPRARPKIDEL